MSASGPALLAAGVCALPVLAVSVAVQQSRRPGYDWRRHPVSCLALGPGARWQTATFVVVGVLLLAGGTGLARQEPAVGVLVALAGVALFASAAFPTDPVSGYPPGTPEPAPRTRRGTLHDLASVPVFLGLPVAAVWSAVSAFGTGAIGWAVLCLGSALVTAVSVVRFGAGFAHERADWVATAGAWQRLGILTTIG